MVKINKPIKINIIGNNNSGEAVSDGGRIKIRLFQTLLLEENIDAGIIELNNWKKHFFRIIREIKHSLKNKEPIVIMAGPNGSRFIIPIVYHLNKKYKTRVVFCPVGIGTIDKIVRNMSPIQLTNFLLCKDFCGKKDKRFSKYLSSFSEVVLENTVLEECYKEFYSLKNTSVLTNFRVFDGEQNYKLINSGSELHCVFLARVCLEKGILDLVECINQINKKSESKIYLDIFGDIQLKDDVTFFSKTNEYVKYCGVVEQNECYKLLSKYDLFVLPTKYHGEGTPGSLVESLIAGTPVLVSNYSQSKELIIEGYNGYLFEMNSLDDLKDKLNFILNNKNKLKGLRKNALESSKKFIYKNIKNDFLGKIGGICK